MPRGRTGSRAAPKHGFELFSHIATRGHLRAFTYRRKSKNAKEDDVSLDEQGTACVSFIAANNWVHVGDAWDMGAEGVDPDRLGYRQMIDWGRQDRFDVLVVWRSDRPFRGVAAAGPLAALLYETNNRVGLASVTDHFDPSYLGINAFVGDQERQAIRRRTMDTRLNYARRGQLMAGSLPYWIARDEQNHGVLILERADVIVELVKRYVNGEPTRTLARWMRQAAPSDTDYRKTSATWNVDRIGKVLKHRALVGELGYSTASYTRRRHPETGNRVRHREWKDDADVVIIPVPPLLHDTLADKATCSGCELDDRPTFAELQIVKARKRTAGSGGPGRPAVHAHPLRNRVWCTVCGHMMKMEAHATYIARDGSKRPYAVPHLYLRCDRGNGRNIESELAFEARTHKCRTPSVLRVKDVYAAVIRHLSRTDLPDAIEQAAASYADAAAEARRSPGEIIDEIRKQRVHLEQLTAREVDLFKTRAELSQAAWRVLQHDLLVEQEGAQQRIAELERDLAEAEAERKRYDAAGIAELTSALREVSWAVLTDAEWAELIPALVSRVSVDGEARVNVELMLPSDSARLSIAVSYCYDTAIIECAA
jgi:DNA invertase Pin-like site-specific DNA recombinase